jgi:hypothetical protein
MKNLLFTVTDHNDVDVCTSTYEVEYRPAGDAPFTTVYPNPAGPDIVIPNLTPGLTYQIRVTRVCCNSGSSDVATFTATIPE